VAQTLRPHLFAAAAVGILVLAACSGSPANQLVIGMELEYPPFETVDDRGAPAGVSADLARALGEHLGREVVIRDYKFKGLTAALSSGKIDLVISSMTATEERAKAIDFSEPYAKIGLALLVQGDSTLTDAASLNSKDITIAVKTGTTGEMFADKHLPNAKLLRLDQAGTCAIEVSQGKADAFIYDQSSVLEFAERHPDTTKALPSPIQTENWAIGIRKGNDELRAQVNAFLEKFRAQGGFEELAEKHLKSQRERFESAGVPFIF
jgi:polar amino acid transport system substrate-binding protein